MVETVHHTTLPEASHRRYNPLTDEWVLVAPHRTARPWDGLEEELVTEVLPEYDPDCYLCPGNERANGEANPLYADTFVFTNDFPALVPDVTYESLGSGLLRAETEPGTCQVMCFSPRHDLTLAGMSVDEIVSVVDLWAELTEKLGQDHRWVQIFENRGAAMGASNPHPHGQVWAGHALPDLPAKEDRSQRGYAAANHRTLLGDYLDQELADGSRIVWAGEHFVVLVPFWAVWPFETLILPRQPVARMPEMDIDQRRDMARALSTLLKTYDAIFNHPFPYSMGWHGAPHGTADTNGWHLHGHVMPPLLRSATIRKFMVGYELLAGAQRDLTAEDAASRLRTIAEGIV